MSDSAHGVQRQPNSSTSPNSDSSPDPEAAAADKRQTSLPTPQQIADRVYQLFCQDLRRERERLGRWRRG